MADLEELLKTKHLSQQMSAKAADSPAAGKQTTSTLPIRQIMPRGATSQDMSQVLLGLLTGGQTTPAPQRSTSAATPSTTTAVPFSILPRVASESVAVPTKAPEEPPATPVAPQQLLQSLLGQTVATASQPPAVETPGKANRFTYVNPFEELGKSAKATKNDQSVEIESQPISVAEKLEQVGEQASKDVSNALDQALAQTKEDEEEVRSSWSTAEDEDSKLDQNDTVEVLNLPMHPFCSIALQKNNTSRPFRHSTWANTTPIARLKKDFSHDDRVLATASSTYILYTVVPTEKKPHAGLKVIRQDDGKNKQIWSTTERLCSVQVVNSQATDVVLATGTNGTIYYTELPTSDSPPFDEVDIEGQGFWMSPPPNSDEPVTGSFSTSSAIRTRAKLSNVNPSTYFAVARGRQIHIISPQVVKTSGCIESTSRKVDADGLLTNNGASINTGKAGKDFCFSEDDTVLASLDKVGKVKFWALDRLTSAAGKLELKEPLYSFQAGVTLKADEKLSPSSIMFLDKHTAYSKKVALRYLLVGYQQNQILQLWDLALQKVVQELHFPEIDNDDGDDGASKGMCSITYHPKTAILCIGHPARNSVYFVHLSSPKYGLLPMTQATFLTHLAKGDTAQLLPESTAIMSGYREYSCGNIGKLRSLDILKTPYAADTNAAGEKTLFELYLMHSKGVLAVPISHADLGWDIKGKLLRPTDAVEAGLAVVKELRQPQGTEDRSSVPSEPTSRVLPKVDKEKSEPPRATAPLPASAAQPAPRREANTTTPVPEPVVKSIAQEPERPLLPSVADTPKPKVSEPLPAAKEVTNAHTNGSAPQHNFDAALSRQFTTLYSKLDTDKRVAEAAGAAKQDAMLRLVSSTLTDNVEASLHNIVATSIGQQVLPALTAQVMASIDRQVQQLLPGAVQQQLSTSLPELINSAFHNPRVVQSIASEVTKQLDSTIKKSITGEFQRLQATLTTKLDFQHESILSTQAETFKGVIGESTKSADSLQATEQRITSLLEAVQAEQARMTAQIIALQQQQTVAVTQEAPAEATKEPSEVDNLTQLLNSGDYEPATIKWLQSEQQAQLFDDLFVRINPAYLQRVSPLIALSVSIAVTSAFDNNVLKRLEWLSSVLDNMDVSDVEIRDVIPKIMDVLIQRLQGAYMQIAETRPTDQDVLRKLASLNRQISEIRKALP